MVYILQVFSPQPFIHFYLPLFSHVLDIKISYLFYIGQDNMDITNYSVLKKSCYLKKIINTNLFRRFILSLKYFIQVSVQITAFTINISG